MGSCAMGSSSADAWYAKWSARHHAMVQALSTAHPIVGERLDWHGSGRLVDWLTVKICTTLPIWRMTGAIWLARGHCSTSARSHCTQSATAPGLSGCDRL